MAMVAPVFYALTRFAWALGFPLGMNQETLRRGQESGTWIAGLFLATFGLVGAVLMLGLVVLLIVGGIGIWSAVPQMVANMAAAGAADIEIIGEIIVVVGPTLLFPVWGLALAVAALGYYYRRRGPCSACGRGA
jgi:hypothetical protein